jgi:hypothetical protein
VLSPSGAGRVLGILASPSVARDARAPAPRARTQPPPASAPRRPHPLAALVSGDEGGGSDGGAPPTPTQQLLQPQQQPTPPPLPPLFARPPSAASTVSLPGASPARAGEVETGAGAGASPSLSDGRASSAFDSPPPPAAEQQQQQQQQQRTRPIAPPSRPLPRIYDLPSAEAARAALLARGPPAAPRRALQLAVEAAARGAAGGEDGFLVPPGATAVFVPAEAVPGAPQDTPAGDLVAYLLPDGEVEGAAGLLGGMGQENGGAPPPPRAPQLSKKSARLLGELRAFAAKRPQ